MAIGEGNGSGDYMDHPERRKLFDFEMEEPRPVEIPEKSLIENGPDISRWQIAEWIMDRNIELEARRGIVAAARPQPTDHITHRIRYAYASGIIRGERNILGAAAHDLLSLDVQEG